MFKKGDGKKSLARTEETQLLELDFASAIKNTKAKYKYRIEFLRCYAFEKVKQYKEIYNDVYVSMDNWIIKTVQKENDALNQLMKEFNDAAENREPIYSTSQMEGFDIYQPIDISVYFKDPLQMTEWTINDQVFNVEDFFLIYKEMKNVEIQKNYIRSESFIFSYVKRYVLSKNKENHLYFGVPANFKSLSFHNIFKLIKLLERNEKELLDNQNY